LDVLRPLAWRGDAQSGVLALIDQRILPLKEVWVECRTVGEVAAAISDMTVRGAPAIGVAAAYGIVIAAREPKTLEASAAALKATRPTAVNLAWAVDEMLTAAKRDGSPEALLKRALEIHDADVEGNRAMGRIGAAHLKDGMRVLTHCNAGALATGGYGTALGVLFAAVEAGKKLEVWVDETRPRLQGARLTAWELKRAGIPFKLIADNMAASVMRAGKIDACIVGADRIASNGDVANKIGTYSVAVNAKHHGVPFYVAAPASTFDLSMGSGAQIPIEERSHTEVTDDAGGPFAPRDIGVFNPGFDVTPAELVTAIFTERGEISPVQASTVARVIARR
jgi:methylthioribose-1-phosphate isomerase